MVAGVAEARTDAAELERRAQERTPKAQAARRVVAALAGLGLEPDALEDTPAIQEFGCDHAADTYPFAVMVEGFVDHGEGVAAAQVAVEVDVRGEHLRHLRGDRIGQVRGIGSREQRTADLARLHLDAALEFLGAL